MTSFIVSPLAAALVYAAMLPILDRVFGTHYLPDHWPADYGIEEPHPATLPGQLIGPLCPARLVRAEG